MPDQTNEALPVGRAANPAAPPTAPVPVPPRSRVPGWIPVAAVVLCTALVLAMVVAFVTFLGFAVLPAMNQGPPPASAGIPNAYAAAQVAPGPLTVEGVAVQDALDAGDLERAQQLADELLARHPDSAEAKLLHATVALQQSIEAGGTAEADRVLCSALEAGLPIAPGMQAAVAGLWLDEGEPERARVLADRAVALLEALARAGGEAGEPADPAELGIALLVRGLARAEMGEPSAGVADLERAVGMAPDAESRKEWQGLLDDLRQRME